MFVKLFCMCFFALLLFNSAKTKDLLSFKNVMVTCINDDAEDEELAYVTTITANRLKPHIPEGQACSRIEIEHSHIPTLYEGALANITNINILLLQNNDIEEIHPGAFTNLEVREGMSLKFNRLTAIRKEVFNNIHVAVLYLSHNSINRIHPEAFDNMPNLRNIYLDDNKLVRIDNNWFKNTPQLRKLVFSKNSITYVPPRAFQNLVMSEYEAPSIDLSRNLISSVDRDAFKSTKKSKFYFVTLAYNQIHNLNPGWLDNVEIKTLDLSSNRIECLMRSGLPRGNSVNYVDNNPWICNCLRDIKQKGSEYGSVIAETDFKRCNIPMN